MRRQFGLWQLAVAVVGLLVLAAAVSPQAVHLADDSQLPSQLTLTRHLPVLFVHGHGFGTATNYQRNWQDDPLGNSLTSFKEALRLNERLGIEPYYISLPNSDTRSITDDASDIRDAVNLILERHDPGFDHTDANSTTHVKIVIIAYSQGTISTRLYLKSLCVNDSRCQEHDPVPGLDPPLQHDFRPVSEFIAIAPPNHGISAPEFNSSPSLATRQLYNGFKPDSSDSECTQSFGTDVENYIQILNGHNMADTVSLDDQANADGEEHYPMEAPGSRSNIDPLTEKPNPPTRGVLYVTIFAANNADFVGGMTPASECDPRDGRTLARNMAQDAINLEVSGIIGGSFKSVVHASTVHTPRVMCLALYAAAHHRAPPSNVNCGSGSVPIIPVPARAAAMLTLDFSGSMSSRDCAACDTRAEILQEAVQLFVRLWSAVSVPSDRIGLIHFDSNVTRFPTSGELLQLNEGTEDLITYVGGLGPGSSTAMGNALQQAIQTLGDPLLEADIRHVILFTDGMQNVNPMARIVNDQLTFVNEPGRPNSIVPPGAPTVLDPSLGIAVDTIGIGAGEAFVGPLRDIADKTKGRSWPTTDPTLDLRRFFVEELINALKGFSPQLVAYRRGAIAANGSTEAFTIEDGVRKLVLKVSWKRGDSMNFSVAKDGVDVTKAGRFIDGAFYKIFVIDLPSKDGIAARGNWQLRINGKAATAYETAAIIDGGRIAYDAMFDSQRPRAGSPLDLVIRLTADGQPIRGNAKVTVNLMSPTTSVGEIIATIKPKELKALEPRTTRAEAQLLALTQDPRMLAALKPKSQTIVLKATEKGDFRTQFRPQIAGNYTAFITIEGDDDKLGHFSRTQTVTTVVRSAPAKLKERDASVSKTNAGGGWHYVTLILSPRDKRGQLMGPGLASAISLELSGGRRVGGTHDLGDGSYMLVLARAPGDDPTINLKVSGDEFFSGRLSKLAGK